jgi:hypothetical protein
MVVVSSLSGTNEGEGGACELTFQPGETELARRRWRFVRRGEYQLVAGGQRREAMGGVDAEADEKAREREDAARHERVERFLSGQERELVDLVVVWKRRAENGERRAVGELLALLAALRELERERGALERGDWGLPAVVVAKRAVDVERSEKGKGEFVVRYVNDWREDDSD